MPVPLAICLEDLDALDASARYLRCVALVGRQPGLRVDAGGQVVWKASPTSSCELWVSADDRLILYRPAASAPVVLHRAGRSLDIPADKPVVMLDQDSFEVGGRRLRVHVHGEAPAVVAPSPLRPTARRTAVGVAAAVALSAAALTGCDGRVEIRETPPEMMPIEQPVEGTPTPAEPPTDEPVTPEPATPEEPTPTQAIVPIEIREEPPDMPAPEEPATEASVKSESAAVAGEDGSGE